MIDSPEILRLIEAAPLFRGIPPDLLEPLFRKAQLRKLKPGEKLLSPGIINEHVYIILAGHLNVQVTPSLADEPIAMLTKGDCVGEMSVLVDGLVSAYVVATTNCELFAIDYSSFWALIDGSNEAARNMLNILVQRVRLGNEVMADSLLYQSHYPDNDTLDNLTGLYNRHGMHVKFDRLLRRSVVGQHPLCLIVLEVDQFEKPSEGGAEFRDGNALRSVAQRMLTFLRPDDHAARLLGNKFAVLLSNIAFADACATAERLRVSISQAPITLPDGNVLSPYTISAGVSEALSDDTWTSLIARAEVALEQAIVAGRNRVAHIPQGTPS